VLLGTNIAGIEYYRKERTVQIYLEGPKRHCMTLSFHPQRSGFYILSAGRSRLDTQEKYRPFAQQVWNGTVKAVRQFPNDRMVEMTLDVKSDIRYLILEALGPNGNLIVLDDARRMIASLRPKKTAIGQPYQPLPLPEKFDPVTCSLDDFRRLFSDAVGIPARAMEKQLYGIDYYLARTIIDKETLDSTDDIDGAYRRLKETVRLYHTTDSSIFAYGLKGKDRYYPVKIIDAEPLGSYASLSQAQRDVLSGIKLVAAVDTTRDKTIKSIQSKIARTELLLSRVEEDTTDAADYERYRQFADLLKINLAHLKRGMKSIDVDDLYGDGTRITIPLDPKLTGTQNIENYSRRYRKGKEGLEILKRRKENAGQELKRLTDALAQFEADFDTAQKEYPELAPAGPQERTSAPAIRLPYKEYQTSTGLTVLVGKTQADNDRLTMEYAKSHELWFHASQCPGSHVVMKYPHKNFEPSKGEIAETASLAAYFSKARNASRVPVSYTLRKYVRKPRGAKPGLVTIQHEKTILVEPREIKKKE